jgi:uridylate kinase
VAKATGIDGIYDMDPQKHAADAKLLSSVSYDRCIRDNLEVMDMEAFALLGKQHIPIRVFSLKQPGNIEAALTGAEIGSLVSSIGD